MSDCVFCKIVKGDIPSTNLYRDEQATAFRDIQPAAPVHILIIPNRHIDSINAMTADDEQIVGHLFNVARQIAAQEGIAEGGYRLIINTNADAGQTVFHIHLHLIGGRRLTTMG